MKRARLLVVVFVLVGALMCAGVALWLFATQPARVEDARKLAGVVGVAALWLAMTVDDWA